MIFHIVKLFSIENVLNYFKNVRQRRLYSIDFHFPEKEIIEFSIYKIKIYTEKFCDLIYMKKEKYFLRNGKISSNKTISYIFFPPLFH